MFWDYRESWRASRTVKIKYFTVTIVTATGISLAKTDDKKSGIHEEETIQFKLCLQHQNA